MSAVRRPSQSSTYGSGRTEAGQGLCDQRMRRVNIRAIPGGGRGTYHCQGCRGIDILEQVPLRVGCGPVIPQGLSAPPSFEHGLCGGVLTHTAVRRSPQRARRRCRGRTREQKRWVRWPWFLPGAGRRTEARDVRQLAPYATSATAVRVWTR